MLLGCRKEGNSISGAPLLRSKSETWHAVKIALQAIGTNTAQKCRLFLGFDTITCAPIDTKLVDFSLLTEAEKRWLEDYHAWVEKAVTW